MPNIPNAEDKFLHVTKKELFYAAAMLKLKRLVNVVYNFPADEVRFEQELCEARVSLRKKKLLTESARSGITLSLPLSICTAFCANPQSCEVVNSDNYHASIYKIETLYMLIEQVSDEDLNITWFIDKRMLDEYISGKMKESLKEGDKN